jgi:predicted glycogen debranching enzyme
MVLVNGLEVAVETAAGKWALSSQHYAPDVIHPDGAERISEFSAEPWPRWLFALPDGTRIEQGILVRPGKAATIVYWRLLAGKTAALSVRPLISGRDYHSMHHENPAFNFEPRVADGRVEFRPYRDVPASIFITNASYTHAPDWYRNFLYAEERARGLDCAEDLASPGTFNFDLARGDAFMFIAAEGHEPRETLTALRETEQKRRNGFASRLHRAADAYIVRRGAGKTVVAGYPWFTDWGRDTFIAIRGLCIAGGRLDDARDILLEWAGSVSEGMLPNRFPDRGETPEFNSVDASLWFIVAVNDFLRAETRLPPSDRKRLEAAIAAILDGYSRGTRFTIHADSDGLLASGVAGVQLTWMDAKVGDWVVTPRIGKPVEVQALWINALRIGAESDRRWAALVDRAQRSFVSRFWDEQRGYLADVVDCDHMAGTADWLFRPNQVFAVGGLPYQLLDGEHARRVIDAIESRILTPLGLRSLARGEPGYIGRYEGGVRKRDGAYHQGTVWPCLMGGFVEAWLRTHGSTRAAKREARDRFLSPLLEHIDDGGLGHLPEIADGDPPHTPRGCPFQAWSVGEALRITSLLD